MSILTITYKNHYILSLRTKNVPYFKKLFQIDNDIVEFLFLYTRTGKNSILTILKF